MINSALNISMSDLDHIGQSKARTYRGPLVAVVENGKLAIVQGYKINSTIADCLPTCIKGRDLSGYAKAVYGEYPDAD